MLELSNVQRKCMVVPSAGLEFVSLLHLWKLNSAPQTIRQDIYKLLSNIAFAGRVIPTRMFNLWFFTMMYCNTV